MKKIYLKMIKMKLKSKILAENVFIPIENFKFSLINTDILFNFSLIFKNTLYFIKF